MGKKKRTNASDSLNVESEASNHGNKEIANTSQESEAVTENIPVFKSLKFVQSKNVPKKSRVWKSLRQIIASERSNIRAITYSNIDATASLKPPKKYSDVSGLEAKYTDPVTKLRFANASEFQFIRSLQPESINAYLALRKAAMIESIQYGSLFSPKNLCRLKNMNFIYITVEMLKLSTSLSLIPKRLSSSYFVTTPIFYVNGVPHIGHMQSCMYADAFARVQRILGNEVIFSTGTDEHGLKVQQAAQFSKKTPLSYCTEISSTFKEMFCKSDVSFTHFIRTSDEKHKETVQNFWKKLRDKGHIKKGSYEGWYSVVEEAFLPSSQVKEIKEGSSVRMVSVDTGSTVEKMSEENYVFSLPSFQDDLLYWLSKDVIKPAIFADDVRRWISEGLGNLSISRPISRLNWGIPVPDDDSQTIYVWLDALVNYLTVGIHDSKNVWPADCHVIGKDILKFHAIYWPSFLIAAGYEPPKQIFCHSHWTANYEKMSKSKGNVIDPNTLINKYGCDGFRYFLLKASVPHSDTNYSETKIHRMLNAELADTLGNLLSRCCAKAINPEQLFPVYYPNSFESLKDSNIHLLINNTSALPGKVKEHFMEGYFYKGLDCIMLCLRDANEFMQSQKPWELVKKDDAENKQKLSTVLHLVMEVLRVCGLLLQPVVPTLSSRLLAKLGVPHSERHWLTIQAFPSWCDLPNKYEGKPLGSDSQPLYERRKEKK